MFNRELKERLKKAEAEIEALKLSMGFKVSMQELKKEIDAKLIPISKLDLDTFPKHMTETKKFKDLIVKTDCPACGHKKLLLDMFTRTPIGWEAMIHCENCIFKGRINSDGFTLEDMHGLGRAKTK